MSSSEAIKTQLAVIGAGPGGYAAAFHAADLGMEVTLVDPAEYPGGVCLYQGCIPSKALLHVAKLLGEADAADEWGIAFEKPDIDLDKLRSSKERVVKKLVGGLAQLVKQRKVAYIRGTAGFVDRHVLELRTAEEERKRLEFEHAIIATGSKPATVPGFPENSGLIVDSTGALELPGVPDELLVVGGGYIGLELGSVYAALGSAVTVVEMMPGLLPGIDHDLVKIVRKRLDAACKDILLETKVAHMKESNGRLEVDFETANGERGNSQFDMALIAVGRVPNSSDLGLEAAGIDLSERGFVRVDSQRRTSNPAVYAIGDVAGEPMLAHKATYEGRVAAEAIAGEKSAFDARAIPAVVFTDPEIAWCGLTELQAQSQGRTVAVTRFPWTASGRAATMARSDGLTKMIFDPESERVLGVGIAGSGAGELIAEGTLAIEMAARAADIGLTIHPHPTLSETLMESADLLFGRATHLYRPRKAKRSE